MENLTDKVIWDESLSLGNLIIDQDHKELFRIYNRLSDCLGREDCKEEFAQILSEMTNYSLAHFSKEEEYLSIINYPHIEQHKNEHKLYIKTVAGYNTHFLLENPPEIYEVVSFLRSWWKNHILNSDSKYEIYRREMFALNVRDRLNSISTKENRESGERYFKESVKIMGVKTADVSKIADSIYKELPYKDKYSVFEVCELLWRDGVMEETFVACNWVYKKKGEFERSEFLRFERWIKENVTNWATCDTFCNHTMGTFIDMYPEFLEKLMIWAKDSNRWVRRAAAVSLIIPAREGRYLDQIIELAYALLKDPDDMVRKGYGWMLKACSQSHRDEVFNFVMKNRFVMPRTALRYAIEKMPQEMREAAMSLK